VSHRDGGLGGFHGGSSWQRLASGAERGRAVRDGEANGRRSPTLLRLGAVGDKVVGWRSWGGSWWAVIDSARGGMGNNFTFWTNFKFPQDFMLQMME
jgi:hypothetical protein